MYYFVVALHVTLCLILIGVILLQPGKGADPGSAFGGGIGATVFGPRGPANVLSRITTAVAILFMVTSVTLALYSDKRTMTGSGGTEEAIEKMRREQLEKKQKKAPETPAVPPAEITPETP